MPKNMRKPHRADDKRAVGAAQNPRTVRSSTTGRDVASLRMIEFQKGHASRGVGRPRRAR